MSYLSRDDIAATEILLGHPLKTNLTVSMTSDELARLIASQRDGRAHDLTVFIHKDGQLLFIAKHSYPPGLYRAPSGAAKQGESLIPAAIREAFEETGAVVILKRYLLRCHARFIAPTGAVDWTSHVFRADYLRGEIGPHDTAEIREARLVEFTEVAKFNQIMLASGIGGFRYRATLTAKALELLPSPQDLTITP